MTADQKKKLLWGNKNNTTAEETNMFSLVVDYSLSSGVVPFIRQLYILLCTNQKSVSDALQWSTDGTRFGIVSDKCLEEIFPLHFPGTDYSNFDKQLVLYGFWSEEKGVGLRFLVG